MVEIIFNDKKSFTDFGIIVESFSIQPPSKKKIKDQVPFMNGSYDFSTVATNGEPVYTQRIIKVRFNLKERSRTALYNKYSAVLTWLLESGQAQLIIDDMTDTYFIAEVETAPSFDFLIRRAGIMDVEFVAEPFKVGKNYVGQELWDNINLETDILQDTSFNINGSKTINIYNPGRAIVPEVIVTADMSCTLDGYTTNFTTNKKKDYRFKLKNGYNTINISGTGYIEFRFRKEVL